MIRISWEQLRPIGQVSTIIPLRTALDKYLPQCMMNQRRCTARSHSQDQPRNHFPNDMQTLSKRNEKGIQLTKNAPKMVIHI